VKKKKKIANKKAKSDRRVAAPTPRAVIICASEIEPKHIESLWPERIGIGHTTTYYGMPEQGKSSQALDVAARVSRGATWPNSDVKAPLGSTLVVAQEDAADEVILWRYKAMGGDVSKLHIFKGIEIPDEKHLEWLDMTRHLHLIDELIRKNQDLKLIIIDPISAYFGKEDTNKASIVRATLGPLNEIAQEHNLAMILIHHVNKNIQQDPLHRMSGSTAFGDFTRQSWLFASRKEEKTRKLMLSAKKSYGPPATGLAFGIIQTEPDEINSVRLEYEPEPVLESAHEVLAVEETPLGRPAKKREPAKQFLREMLADGPVPRKKVRLEADCQSIGERTLQRAVKDLKLTKVIPKTGKHKGKLCWKMRQNSRG